MSRSAQPFGYGLAPAVVRHAWRRPGTWLRQLREPPRCSQGMFSVYCPAHGSAVLLSIRNIRRIDNRSDGIHVHWRCFCGQTGTWETGRC